MKYISQKFNMEKCRIESGIFYGDDFVHKIHYEKSSGYFCDEKVPLTELVRENGDDWLFDIAPLAEWNDDKISVVVGGGAYEGEGFVAFLIEGELQWILHMEASEAFTKVDYVGGKVIAVATNYPHNNRIEIPVVAPNEFFFQEQISL